MDEQSDKHGKQDRPEAAWCRLCRTNHHYTTAGHRLGRRKRKAKEKCQEQEAGKGPNCINLAQRGNEECMSVRMSVQLPVLHRKQQLKSSSEEDCWWTGPCSAAGELAQSAGPPAASVFSSPGLSVTVPCETLYLCMTWWQSHESPEFTQSSAFWTLPATRPSLAHTFTAGLSSECRQTSASAQWLTALATKIYWNRFVAMSSLIAQSDEDYKIQQEKTNKRRHKGQCVANFLRSFRHTES